MHRFLAKGPFFRHKYRGADPLIKRESYFLRELQYHKLLKNICTRFGHKCPKEEPSNACSINQETRKKLLKKVRRDQQVQTKSTLPKAPVKKECELDFCYQVDEAKGLSSCSRYAPISPPRFNQRSFFSPQDLWCRSFHKSRKFKKVTHCIFDMDGTIIDSECLYHKIVKELCTKYGKKYTKELESKNFGATDKQICENMVKDLQLNISATELEKQLKEMTKNRLSKAPLKKGAEKLLKHLVRSGVLFALATNSTRRDVRLHIARKPKIFRMFHHMVCAGDPDVDRGKPFPDLFLIAAAKFPDKPPPVKCLVFEDSLVGLEAGVAAGMQVVMTPPKCLPTKDCSKATLVIPSLLDFKPELFGLPPFTGDIKNKPKRNKF